VLIFDVSVKITEIKKVTCLNAKVAAPLLFQMEHPVYSYV